MKDIVLETAALTKRYPQGTAVDHVDMVLPRGEIYGFIGLNGAGKTTLIRMVTGLIHPTSGEVRLFGQADPQELAQGRRQIGSIVEAPAFFPKLTARQNLEYYRIQRGIPEREAVDSALKLVKLTDTGRKKYKDFSLGMKQRLGLALAVMGRPDLLILDEPVNGLDPTGIIEFRSIIRDLRDAHGMTVLISSHILSELSQVATTFGIIHQGRLVRQINARQLEEETKRCIAVRVDDVAAAAAVLHEKLHTGEFQVLGDNEIRVFGYLENPSEVTFQLSTNGVRVLSAQEQGANLEEFFLQTIGENNAGRDA